MSPLFCVKLDESLPYLILCHLVKLFHWIDSFERCCQFTQRLSHYLIVSPDHGVFTIEFCFDPPA